MDFVDRRYDGCWPSTLSMTGGPSCTGDSEKILVTGAHRPKHLVVYWSG